MTPSERKIALRATVSSSSRLLVGGHAEAESLRTQDRFLRAFPPSYGERLALYFGVRDEVRTDRIRDRALEVGAEVFFPRVGTNRSLRFFPHRAGDVWEKGLFGIPEPSVISECDERRLSFDLIVVPGLAFDIHGGRLGKGHGYYDRFLSGLSPETRVVGLAFPWQVVEEVPMEAHDVPVHAVVTGDDVWFVDIRPGSSERTIS